MINEEIRALLYEVDEEGEGLTPWEVIFIADLIDQLATGRLTGETLTPTQCEKIQEIHARRMP